MMKEKGFQFAEVTHEIKEMPGGPKLVHLTFTMDEGPKVKIREIEFVGNKAISDGALQAPDEGEQGSSGSCRSSPAAAPIRKTKFEEDAERVIEYYRDHGYIKAQVGEPELKFLERLRRQEDALDRAADSGHRRATATASATSTSPATRSSRPKRCKPLFKLKPGEYYSQKRIRKGFQKAQEIYGAGGYMEFTGYPGLQVPATSPNPAEPAGARRRWRRRAGRRPTAPPIVDVTMQIQEGKQYFVNRITFIGNTTTRDNVIRREMRLYENGVFNTEALKYSIKRLNQLGYFKPLEGPGKDVNVDKTPNDDEQGRRQDEARRAEPQPAHVRRRRLAVRRLLRPAVVPDRELPRPRREPHASRCRAARARRTTRWRSPSRSCSTATSPAASTCSSSEVRYIGQFTQQSTGGVADVRASRSAAASRGCSRTTATSACGSPRSTSSTSDPVVLARNPFLRDSLLIGAGRRAHHQQGHAEHRLQHGRPADLPDHRPAASRRRSTSPASAATPTSTSRWSKACGSSGRTRRHVARHARRRSSTSTRSADRRSCRSSRSCSSAASTASAASTSGPIGPQDPTTGLVLGGNKSLLFNVEEQIHIAGPVRLILFYDAGQVQRRADSWSGRPPAVRAALGGSLDRSDAIGPAQNFTLASDFKTSTGAEIRFFMPVLNVPFRLIFAYNPQRGGVLDNSLQPQKAFQFRFAVGHDVLIRHRRDSGFTAKGFSRNERFRYCRVARRCVSERVAASCPGAPAQPAQPGAAPPAPRASARAGRRPRPRSRRAAPRRRPQPPAPFPQGAKVAFVNLQAIAQLSADGKAAARQGQGADAEEADRGRRQGQGAAGQSAEAADQRQRDERAARGAAREGNRAADRATAERFEQDAQAELNELQQELQNEFQRSCCRSSSSSRRRRACTSCSTPPSGRHLGRARPRPHRRSREEAGRGAEAGGCDAEVATRPGLMADG